MSGASFLPRGPTDLAPLPHAMAPRVLRALMLAGGALTTTAPAPEGTMLPIGVQELPSALYGQQGASDQSKPASGVQKEYG